jgi:hypothetical protein
MPRQVSTKEIAVNCFEWMRFIFLVLVPWVTLKATKNALNNKEQKCRVIFNKTDGSTKYVETYETIDRLIIGDHD